MNKWIYILLFALSLALLYVLFSGKNLEGILDGEIKSGHTKGSWHIGTINGEVMGQTRMDLIIKEEKIGMAYYDDEKNCTIKSLPIETMEKDYIETKKSEEGFVSLKVVDHDTHSDGDKEVTFMVNSMVEGMPSGISSGNKIRMYESTVVSARCRGGVLETTNDMSELRQ
jgi:hypothetical protein